MAMETSSLRGAKAPLSMEEPLSLLPFSLMVTSLSSPKKASLLMKEIVLLDKLRVVSAGKPLKVSEPSTVSWFSSKLKYSS